MTMRVEIRNDSVVLDGYVNACERISKPIPSIRGTFKEKIQSGAFQRSLEKRDNVDLLLNHDKSKKLGSTSEGNLELFEDSIGLRAICTIYDPIAIQKARDKKLKGWSFGFYAKKDKWDKQDGIDIRTVEELDMFEVTIVDDTRSPAYIATTIEMRDNEEVLKETRMSECETVVVDKTEEDKKEEKREVDYTLYEKEIEKLKIKS